MTEQISFPRQYARTQRFTLGVPRSFSIADDGSRVAFLRSPGGEDPSTCLWVFDVDAATERLVADPRDLLSGQDEQLSDEEKARRERARETAGGIVAYGGDANLRVAAFVVAGRLFVADLGSGDVRELATEGGSVFDPRPDPTGRRVGYVAEGALHVIDVDGSNGRALAADDDPDVSWGMAEFVAAEEMDRLRGYWWAPDGESIAAARVDNRPVPLWHIADPSDPAAEPRAVRYPAAGTNDADVSLFVIRLDGARIEIDWDRRIFPYLVEVAWAEGRPLTLLVQSRDQAAWQVLAVDASSGRTHSLTEDASETWLEILPGVPSWTGKGRLVFVREADDTRHVTVDGKSVTPPGLQVRRVAHTRSDLVLTASHGDPMEAHVWSVLPTGEVSKVTSEPGVHEAIAAADVLVVTSSTMDADGPKTVVRRGSQEVGTISSFAATPVLRPEVTFLPSGEKEPRSALLFPNGQRP